MKIDRIKWTEQQVEAVNDIYDRALERGRREGLMQGILYTVAAVAGICIAIYSALQIL